MKLPISDLMDTCTTEDIELTADINTEAVKTKTLSRIRTKQKLRRHPKPRVLLIAAIVAGLLMITAAAVGGAIAGRYVDDPSELSYILKYTVEDGTVRYVKAEHPNASYAITFDLEVSQDGMVYYKLNQLPYPAHDAWPKPVDTSDWIPYWEIIQNDGYYTDPDRPYRRNGEMLYQVKVYTSTAPDCIYFFNGEVLSEKYDTWRGMSRLRLSIDYSNTEETPYYDWDGPPVNYLILADPETGCVIYIAGTLGFEDLEAIAEHMEIIVTDEVDEHKEFIEEWRKEHPSNTETIGPNVSWMDIGRG